MLIDRFVEKWGEDWCQKEREVFDEGWFDFVDVAGFVGIDFVHDFCDLFFCYMFECEGW